MGRLILRHMHYKGIRIPVFILSILINALGIDLIIVAGFGSSPISSVPIVISLYSNWTFGQITFFANILFIAAQIALLRRLKVGDVIGRCRHLDLRLVFHRNGRCSSGSSTPPPTRKSPAVRVGSERHFPAGAFARWRSLRPSRGAICSSRFC